MWDLVGNPEDGFSHNEAHMRLVVNKPVFRLDSYGPAQLQKLAGLEISDKGTGGIKLSKRNKIRLATSLQRCTADQHF